MLYYVFFQKIDEKQWPNRKKEGKIEEQKFDYLENKKGFLDEIIIANMWWKNDK